PLQNLRADRYLLLAVMGPALVLAALCCRIRRGALLGGALVAAFAALTIARAEAFTSSVALWTDAAARAPGSARVQYQLAMALREVGRNPEAEAPFRRALAAPDDIGRR